MSNVNGGGILLQHSPRTVTEGGRLIFPLCHSYTIWHVVSSCSPMESVSTAILSFGLKCHVSLLLTCLLVRTNHVALQKEGMYNLPMGREGEEKRCVYTLKSLPKWCSFGLQRTELRDSTVGWYHQPWKQNKRSAYWRKYHHVQGIVSLGNSYFRSICEKNTFE